MAWVRDLFERIDVDSRDGKAVAVWRAATDEGVIRSDAASEWLRLAGGGRVLEIADGVLDLGVAAMVGLEEERVPRAVGDESMEVVATDCSADDEAEHGRRQQSPRESREPARRQRGRGGLRRRP